MEFISTDIYQQKLLWSRPNDDISVISKQINKLKQQQQAFARRTITERTEIISSLGHNIEKHKDELAEMICVEVGRCLSECKAEIDKTINLIQYYTHLAPELLSEKIIATQASLSKVCFEPLGVVLAVMPWNYPVWQILRFAIPALCAGNACLVKPAPSVGRISEKLFSLVDNDLPLSVAWISHQDFENILSQCDALAFTGSAKTGSHLASIAGRYIKKCVLELGGSNAFVVLKDAQLEIAAQDACNSRFRDAGQSCNAAKRIIVEDCVADEFIVLFKQYCQKLKSGDPMLPETTLALLHQKNAAEKCQAFVDDALAQGAKLVLGGKMEITPHMYPATILDKVSTSAKVAQEEVFGPIASIMRANNADDAIDIANNTPFGLGSCIYSGDTNYAWELAKKLNVGSVFINRHTSSDLRLPFGGVKASGFGRELSEFGLYEFVNIKSYWQK